MHRATRSGDFAADALEDSGEVMSVAQLASDDKD